MPHITRATLGLLVGCSLTAYLLGKVHETQIEALRTEFRIEDSKTWSTAFGKGWESAKDHYNRHPHMSCAVCDELRARHIQ